MRLLTTALLSVIVFSGAQILAGELHDAVSAGDLAKVEQLLADGADVNEKTYNDFRPLHLADDPAIVATLLRYKPELNVDSASGTPLQNAADRFAWGRKDAVKWRAIVDLLLKAQADYDIVSAIHLDDLARVQTILQNDPKAALGPAGAYNPLHPASFNAPLRVAAREGREEICRLLLLHHADPNDVKRGSGFPILESAVKYPAIVKQLIDAGADVNQRITWRGGRTGSWVIGDEATALHYAAGHGVPDTVTMLIDRGVDVFAIAHDITDESVKQTALDVAAIFGKAKNAAAIVNHAAFRSADQQVRQQALDHALLLGASGPSELLELLLRNGADPNAQDDNASVIQFVAHRMRPEADDKNAVVKQMVAELVEHGARLDLFSAVAIGDDATVSELLKQDSTIANARGPDGYPALNVAVSMNYEEIVALLVEAHCDVNIRSRGELTDAPSETPLHCAASRGRTELAKTLIAAGADVNARDEWKRTPLHDAAITENVDVVRLLLDHGASIEVQDDQGATPLDDCRSLETDRGREIEKLLLERLRAAKQRASRQRR